MSGEQLNTRGENSASSEDEESDWKTDRDNTPVVDSAPPSSSEDEGDWFADWRKQRSGI